MSVRNDITIDWLASPRIITVADTSDAITVQDLHDTVVYMEWLPNNMVFPHIISSAGKEALGGSVYVGITTTLQNAKLAFAARGGPGFTQCNVSGGNLVALDDVGAELDPIQTTAYTQVVRTSSSSATLQELADIQYSSFGGGVTVDTTSGNSGTEYPTGTPRETVDNLADALTIATERGFSSFFIIGDITVASGDYSGFSFVGESITKTTITISAPATLTGCEFYEATVTGTLDGNNLLRNCALETLNYVFGTVESCILGDYTITLGGSNPAFFLDCWSGVPGTGSPVIDMGGSGQDLNIRNYNGGIKLTNLTGGSQNISLDINSGHVNLDSTITDGIIVVRGVGKLTDNSGGTATVQDDWFLQGDDVQNAARMIYNKVTRSGDVITVYEDDGVTVWKTFSLASGGRVEQ